MIAKMMLVIQLAIGTVLLLAVAGKWRSPINFAHGVADYDVLPYGLSIAFGVLLIPLETTLAVSHLTGWWISVSAPVTLVIFGVFAVAVAINLGRGRSLPCYCFGDEQGEPISTEALGRLLLLLGGEGFLLIFSRQLGRPLLVHHQLTSLRALGFALFWTTLLMVAATWILGLRDFLELLRQQVADEARAKTSGRTAPA